jgi:hypothetical protein
MLGVYENLNEMTTQLAQYKNNTDECEKCAIKRFEQVDADEEDSTKPQWREYWANRQ